jgi:fused signal recognition particle receptor
VRLENEAQIRRLKEDRAELEVALEAARQAEAERLRMEAEREISEAENRPHTELRRLDEEKAQLEAVIEARQAEVERLRMEAESQMEVVAQQRAGVEQVRLETEAEIRRLEEERAEREAAVEARQAEAVRLRMEAKRELSEAENRSRAEHEQFLLPTADLERVTEEAAHRRVEVEASLNKALEEDRRLLEMQQATEQSRQPSSAELLWLEPDICQRTDIDQRLLEETRLRAQDQQQLIEEEAQCTAEV